MDAPSSSTAEADAQTSLASTSEEGTGCNAQDTGGVSRDDSSARVDDSARETITSLETIDEDAAPIYQYDCEEEAMSSERKSICRESLRESLQSIRESLQSIQESELSIPSESAALSHDDSLNKSKSRIRKMASWSGRERTTDSTDSNVTADEIGLQTQLRIIQSLRSVLPVVEREEPNPQDQRNGHGSRSRPFAADIQPIPSYVRRASDDIVTADVRISRLSIPYVNESDEICVPEATAVADDDIPSATVVRPEKYSLTIAGYKCQLRFVVLLVLIVLSVGIALTATLSRKSVVDQPIPVYSSSTHAPTTSMIPTMAPSIEPSITPTSTLQANLKDIIYKFSGGNISNAFEDIESSHHKALNWLVNDQLEQSEGHFILPDAEIVERYVLALIYYETFGDGWSNSFDFMTKEHVCKWRGSLRRTWRKGVTKCTHGSTGRVMNLTLWNNNLQGSLPTEIGLLKELNALHVGFNDIEGTIPSALANITHLELNNNDFFGPIDALASMTNLRFVDLSSNDLSGKLMNASHLTRMESFKISNNQLTGAIPESLKHMSSLETLHMEDNRLSGSINFLCHDLPSDYLLDCYATEPEVVCNCCVGCTIENDEECDLESETMITLDIHSGHPKNGFNWVLDGDDATVAAGGEYADEERVNIQLCLAYPGRYTIFTGATPDKTTDADKEGYLIYSIGDFSTNGLKQSSVVGANDSVHIYLTEKGVPLITTEPTQMPTPTPSEIPTWVPTSNYPTFSPNNLPIQFRPPSQSSPISGACGDFVAKKDCIKSSCGWDNDNDICIAILDEVPESIGPFPSVNCGDFSTGIECMSSSDIICAWDDEAGLCYYVITDELPDGPGQDDSDSNEMESDGRYPEGAIHCDIGLKFDLSLTTDAFGSDTTWELFDRNTNDVVLSNSSFPSNQTFQFSECIKPRGCYEFRIMDAWDDGICCEQGNGSYNVSINDRLIATGGEFGSSESVFLGGNCGLVPTEEGTCEEGHTLLNMTIIVDQFSAGASWTVFDASTGQLYATNEDALALNTMAYTSLVKCIPEKDCYQLSVYDKEMEFEGYIHWILEYNNEVAVSKYGDPGLPESTTTFGPHCMVEAPEEKDPCGDGNALLNMTIFTHQWGSEVIWEVSDLSTGDIYATNEGASKKTDVTTSWSKCIPEMDCYLMTMKNPLGLHYLLEYDGTFNRSGSGGSVSDHVGPNCEE